MLKFEWTEGKLFKNASVTSKKCAVDMNDINNEYMHIEQEGTNYCVNDEELNKD